MIDHSRISKLAAVTLAAALCVPPATATTCWIHNIKSAASGPGGRLFVEASFGSAVSVDGGASWTDVKPPGIVWLAVAGHDLYVSNTLAERMYRSRDIGQTWEPIGAGHHGPAIDKAGNLYACDRSLKAVERRDAATGKWEQTGPLRRKDGSALAENACASVVVRGDRLYVLAPEAIFQSSTESLGKRWLPTELNPEVASPFPNMFMDGTSTVYVSPLPYETAAGISVSRDLGATWEELGAKPGPEQWHQVAGADAQYVYAIGFNTVNGEQRPLALYRLRGGISEKVTGIDLPPRAGPATFRVGVGGTMTVAGGRHLMLSADRGKSWRTIDLSAAMKRAWSDCSRPHQAPPLQSKQRTSK